MICLTEIYKGILKSLGYINCAICGKSIPKKETEVLRISESPKDKVGIRDRVCKDCYYFYN